VAGPLGKPGAAGCGQANQSGRQGRGWVQAMEHPAACARQILINVALDGAAQRARRTGELAAADCAGTRDPVDNRAERDLHEADTQQELPGALATMTARQRAVIVLRYREDLPEAEVAEIPGCSVGTVKSTASRGLARLCTTIGDDAAGHRTQSRDVSPRRRPHVRVVTCGDMISQQRWCPLTANRRLRRKTGTYSRGMAHARYDAVADFYVSGFDSTDDSVSLALLELLGPVAGLRVLDVACGHGRITRELARRGADVVGIDISGNLISKARESEQNEPLGIRYIHADVTAPEVLGGHEFDVVACSFGLSDIDDLAGAVAAISGALRPRGWFAFSILHPCFAGGKDISGSWPPTGSYYDEGHWTAQGALSTLRQQVGANHRMLSTYLSTLRRHSLWLDRIAEPFPPPDWDQAHDADRKPVYLAIRSIKMIEGEGGLPSALRQFSVSAGWDAGAMGRC
jgi:2-polyprenyl-3-methyl-5-hydroxy-6-metoxy-1,4-benzoquinol methylase